MEPGIEVEAFHALCAPAPPETFVRLLYATGFSASAYNAHYADVAAMRWPLTNVLAHFLTHGLAERRAAPMTLNPDALVALARLPIANRAFRAALLANLAAPLATGLDQPWGPAIARHWSAARQLMGSDAHPFLIVGDSHSHQFNLASIRGAAWSLPIHVLCTGGSAMGLANPNSRSGYGQALLALFREIETLPGADALPLLMQFGQVDIEFVHHFRRVRDNRTALDLAVYRQFCEMVQERYLQFLCEFSRPTAAAACSSSRSFHRLCQTMRGDPAT